MSFSFDGFLTLVPRAKSGLPPVAGFTYIANSDYEDVGQMYSFTDTSENSPTSWLWDFGDGGGEPQTGQNPYFEWEGWPAPHTVTLSSQNEYGEDSIVQSVDASGFEAVDVGGGQIDFFDTSTGSPTSWLWDFGDGTTSAEQNPSKIYQESGTYTVRLTATYPLGSSSGVRSIEVIVLQPPIASFSAIPTAPPEQSVFFFINTSTGDFTTWSWDFGDGSPPSNEMEPMHVYPETPGSHSYNASLTVTGPGGSDSDLKMIEYVI